MADNILLFPRTQRGDSAGSFSRMRRSIRWMRSAGHNACGAGPHDARARRSNERYHRLGSYAILRFDDINR
jgi:hypothetical protein